MKFFDYLLKFLPLVPSIAAGVEGVVSGASVETKTALAAQSLQLATSTAAALLPGEEGQIAAAAGQSALAVLNATVAAIHNANNPPPAPTPAG